jgi:hypothetical protein
MAPAATTTLKMRMSRPSTVEGRHANFGVGNRFQEQRGQTWLPAEKLRNCGGPNRSCGGVRFPAMAREIDSLADKLREDGAHAKRAAKVAVDTRAKERLDRIAKKDQAKAIDVENDFS